jgi:hypothetical protein
LKIKGRSVFCFCQIVAHLENNSSKVYDFSPDRSGKLFEKTDYFLLEKKSDHKEALFIPYKKRKA